MEVTKKLEKTRIFRDPLYGNIVVEYQVIWDLINTREFQRLRRIRQLSGVEVVFHTAEHSRFSHSIGTYHIAYRFVSESVLKDYFSEYEKVLFMAASLVHDIGHGPFSHAFEKAFAINHELMGQRILTENTEISLVLASYGEFQKDVVNVLSHGGKYPIIENLVSSQLDVDRLDYLNRDASHVAANYGYVDVDRIVRILRIQDGKVAYLDKGINTIENYLMSRYHMYWQIYYHKRARSYEVLLENIYTYIIDHKNVIKGHKAFIDFLFDNNNLDAYLMLDDYYIVGMILEYINSPDKDFAYLISNFVNRKLLSYVTLKEGQEDMISSHFQFGDAKYYYKAEEISQVAYLNNKRGQHVSEILILEDGKLLPLDKASKVVAGLLESGKKKEKTIFYDENKLQ